MNRSSLLVAYALANAVLYSMLLPLWEGFDEPFHFGYVQQLANGNGFPDPRSSVLSQEVETSLLIAPASFAVQRNLPRVTSYDEFFGWSESRRQEARRKLLQIDRSLRWQASQTMNYEGQQAPLAYLVLAFPERIFANLSLPSRVMALRFIAGAAGALLLTLGARRLAGQLGIAAPHKSVLVFCTLSSQMTWATLAHVGNDWLAVPLSVWLLVAFIHYLERPDLRRMAIASVVLSLGLLTKAYFLAFIPALVLVSFLGRRWKDLWAGLIVTLVVAGPWYMRNVERYGSLSGMQELTAGTDPTAAINAVRFQSVPGAIELYARSALWMGNNTFRTFSPFTLRLLLTAWAAGLVLWIWSRPRRADWLVAFHCGMFALALAYDTAVNYVASHGAANTPAPWYTQVLVVPMLALAVLGASRSRKIGTVVACAMTLLAGYILVVTYWIKLIPLYGGFQGRVPLRAAITIYATRFTELRTWLSDASLGPAILILLMSGLVTILATAEQVSLLRRLLENDTSKRKTVQPEH